MASSNFSSGDGSANEEISKVVNLLLGNREFLARKIPSNDFLDILSYLHKDHILSQEIHKQLSSRFLDRDQDAAPSADDRVDSPREPRTYTPYYSDSGATAASCTQSESIPYGNKRTTDLKNADPSDHAFEAKIALIDALIEHLLNTHSALALDSFMNALLTFPKCQPLANILLGNNEENISHAEKEEDQVAADRLLALQLSAEEENCGDRRSTNGLNRHGQAANAHETAQDRNRSTDECLRHYELDGQKVAEEFFSQQAGAYLDYDPPNSNLLNYPDGNSLRPECYRNGGRKGKDEAEVVNEQSIGWREDLNPGKVKHDPPFQDGAARLVRGSSGQAVAPDFDEEPESQSVVHYFKPGTYVPRNREDEGNRPRNAQAGNTGQLCAALNRLARELEESKPDLMQTFINGAFNIGTDLWKMSDQEAVQELSNIFKMAFEHNEVSTWSQVISCLIFLYYLINSSKDISLKDKIKRLATWFMLLIRGYFANFFLKVHGFLSLLDLNAGRPNGNVDRDGRLSRNHNAPPNGNVLVGQMLPLVSFGANLFARDAPAGGWMRLIAQAIGLAATVLSSYLRSGAQA